MTAGVDCGLDSAVALRPVSDGDRAFLLRLYGSTRADELALVDWTETQKQTFVTMQFTAQDSHYREHYPAASFDVVLLHGEPVGRLYVDRRAREIRIVDIALLPERRNAGLGTFLLRRLMEEAGSAGHKVSIHVETFNRASRLYGRLGFVPAAERGPYMLMEWTPTDAGAPVPRQEITAS